MRFYLLALILVFFSFSALANGRSPAVEDFVGIEVDHVESTPRGSESLFNLETDMQKVSEKEQEGTQKKVEPSNDFSWNPLTVSTVAVLLLLPMFACLVFMRQVRKKATIESASNIEVLEKYRKEREARKNQEKSQDFKKVS